MNPSPFGDLDSGFSNSSENAHILTFNAPPSLQRSSTRPLSRPRMVKVRRQSSQIPKTWEGPGFNPFGTVSGTPEIDFCRSSKGRNEAYVNGESRNPLYGNVENEVIDRLKNVKIGSGMLFQKNSSNADTRTDFVFGSDHNQSSIIDDNSIKSRLPDELNSKLNLKETGVFYMGDEISNVLPDHIKKLNVNETHGKSSSVGESMENSRSYAGHQRETILMSEMEKKLSIGSSMEESSGRTNMKFSSSQIPKPTEFSVPGGLEKNEGFVFAGKKDDTGLPFVEFKTPNSRVNLFSGSNQKVEICTKLKDSKLKKKKGKVKQPTKVHLCSGKEFFSMEIGCQEVSEASDSYSPMDVSPYRETLSDAHYSRETSVASEESFNLDNQYTDSQPTGLNDSIDEDLIVATQQMDINEEVPEFGEMKQEGFNSHEDNASAAETESFKSANEEIDCINDVVVSSAENEASSSTSIHRTQCGSLVSSEEMGGSSFTFVASSSAQSSPRRNYRRKSLGKVANNSCCSSPSASSYFTAFSDASLLVSPPDCKKVGPTSPAYVVQDNSLGFTGQDFKQKSDLNSAASIAAQEACERWRLRGNQAYTQGDLCKAQDCYTQGINCISKSETSRSTLRALMLCYSNRAATLMSLGRLRDALVDCEMAAEIDPSFLRVQVRAAK